MKYLRNGSSIVLTIIALLMYTVLPATAGYKQVGSSVETMQEKPNTPGTDGPVAPFE